MRKAYLALITSLAVILASAAFAESAAVGTVDQRQERQEKRIEQGLSNGALNAREAARLERRETRIEQKETKALEDGSLSKKEERKIRRRQNSASRAIRRQKHDAPGRGR